MKTIKILVKQQYGKETFMPACKDAELFASIAGTKTLTRRSLACIQHLGYKIELIQQELVIH